MPPKSPAERAQALKDYESNLKNLRNEFPNRMKSAKCDQINIVEYEILKSIGSGGFAKVYKGKRGDQIVAIKAQKKVLLYPHHVSQVIQEKQILCAMDSNLICKVLAKWKDPEYLYLMMEYAKFGDLMDYLSVKDPFTEEDSRRIMSQVVCGLEYIHACNLIYRDVKPENCLVYENGRLKISDFGLTVVAGPNINDYAGSHHYCAPELFTGENYSDAIDWWAVGVMTYEMNLRQLPFSEGSDTKEVVREKVTLPLKGVDESSLSAEGKDLIKKLLEKNPAHRLGTGKDGATAVKQHPWFQSVDWYNVIFGDIQFDVPLPEHEGENTDANIFKNVQGSQNAAWDKAFADF